MILILIYLNDFNLIFDIYKKNMKNYFRKTLSLKQTKKIMKNKILFKTDIQIQENTITMLKQILIKAELLNLSINNNIQYSNKYWKLFIH
jgi:hypothetical protein